MTAWLCWIGWHSWKNAEIGRRIGTFDAVKCIDCCRRCHAQRVRVMTISRLYQKNVRR